MNKLNIQIRKQNQSFGDMYMKMLMNWTSNSVFNATVKLDNNDDAIAMSYNNIKQDSLQKYGDIIVKRFTPNGMKLYYGIFQVPHSFRYPNENVDYLHECYYRFREAVCKNEIEPGNVYVLEESSIIPAHTIYNLNFNQLNEQLVVLNTNWDNHQSVNANAYSGYSLGKVVNGEYHVYGTLTSKMLSIDGRILNDAEIGVLRNYCDSHQIRLKINQLGHELDNYLGFDALNDNLLAISRDWCNDQYQQDLQITLRKAFGDSIQEIGVLTNDKFHVNCQVLNQAEIDVIKKYCNTYQIELIDISTATKSVLLSDEQWTQVLDSLDKSVIKSKIERQLN